MLHPAGPDSRLRAYKCPGLSSVWWWLVAMAGAALFGGRINGHYFLLMLPPLCVLAGVGARSAFDGSRHRRRLWSAGLAATSLAFLVYAAMVDPVTDSLWVPSPDYRLAAEHVRDMTQPEDSFRVTIRGRGGRNSLLSTTRPARQCRECSTAVLRRLSVSGARRGAPLRTRGQATPDCATSRHSKQGSSELSQ
ncbi:MAG: hypothetical protein JWN04_2802 [Myxococcaceae bacterium]|nr:hypothetical protein [Myxococcaceae bacterium]